MPDKELFQQLDLRNAQILYNYVIYIENILYDKNFSQINGLPQNMYVDVNRNEGLYILPNFTEALSLYEVSSGIMGEILREYYKYRTFIVVGFRDFSINASSPLVYKKELYGALCSEVLKSSPAKKSKIRGATQKFLDELSEVLQDTGQQSSDKNSKKIQTENAQLINSKKRKKTSIKLRFFWDEDFPVSKDRNCVYLVPRNPTNDIWDDSWTESLKECRECKFAVRLISDGNPKYLGEVLLVRVDDSADTFYDLVESEIVNKVLPKSIISIGGVHYYRRLKEIKIRSSILLSLNDYPYNMIKIDDHQLVSYMSLAYPDIDRLRRLAKGEPELTNYKFQYVFPKRLSDVDPPHIDFFVDSNDIWPSSNMQAIIGSNGCGKTTLLRNLVSTILYPEEESHGSVKFSEAKKSRIPYVTEFKYIIYVSYSTLDPYWSLLEQEDLKGKSFTFIGNTGHILREPQNLTESFYNTMERILDDEDKRMYWEEIIGSLSSITQFRDFGIDSNVEGLSDTNEVGQDFLRSFEYLSAGHKSVIYTLARLIDVVVEKTLVLIDEPEVHLHPPLLAGFVRALSKILVAKNGVGILATHSPVVLQEIPKKCIWVLQRAGDDVIIKHPTIETFGESLATITNTIFEYEITDTGYHSLLRDVANQCDTYEEALKKLNGQLGEEGRAVLLSLMMLKVKNNV